MGAICRKISVSTQAGGAGPCEKPRPAQLMLLYASSASAQLTGRRRVTLTVQTPPEVTVLAIKPAAVLIVVIRKGS